MQTLLDKIGIIDYKYQELKKQDQFNIFALLRKITDEEHLHSRFIFELLHPDGTHNKGDLFLKYFLDIVGIKHSNDNVSKILVTKEWMKIDLLIRYGNQAIIIENKIEAQDQDKQLQRYYEKVKGLGFTKSNIHLIYLTPFGDKPSQKSIGNLDKEYLATHLFNISYKEDILNWIEQCIAACATQPSIRESLVQYHHIIKRITGQTMSKIESKKVIQLLKKGQNINYAKKIVEVWSDVKFEAEWNFWLELEATIKDHYTLLQRQKITKSIVRKSNTGGLMFELPNLSLKNDTDQICFYIERAKKENLRYGITVISKDKRQGSQAQYQNCINIVGDILGHQQPSDWWIGLKDIEPNINFDLFSNEDTLKLIKEKERNVFIDNLWQEIQQFILTFLEKATSNK